VQSLLGLLNYFRRHIKDYGKIAVPLLRLIKKDTPFIWTEQCENPKTTLIGKITSSPVLKFPVFDGEPPFTLYTDASSKAAGALLAQVQESQEYPIAFYSKVFSQAQC